MDIDAGEGGKPTGPGEEGAKADRGKESGEEAEVRQVEDSKPIKKKKTVKKTEVPVVSDIRFGLDERALNHYKEAEVRPKSLDRRFLATFRTRSTHACRSPFVVSTRTR